MCLTYSEKKRNSRFSSVCVAVVCTFSSDKEKCYIMSQEEYRIKMKYRYVTKYYILMQVLKI
jgi:hypothetical protein